LKFIKIDSNPDFDLAHYISTGGQWEIGVRLMIFGVRICGNRVGSIAYAFDYCAGANMGFAQVLLLVMFSILDSLPEEITERELENMLPSWEVRPIDRDPCWGKLQQLAIKLAKSEEVECQKH
jgi:hypothetical protein